MSQSPAKRAMMSKSTSERLMPQDRIRPASSQSLSVPRSAKKEKKNEDELPYMPSSRKTSLDFENEEEFDDSNSGINGIRRSKRKSKKRVFPDAVADLKDFSDSEDKIPGRLIPGPKPRPVDDDSDASDIDNLLENDTNDETTSDNEKQDESIEIDVEESTAKIKKEIIKEKKGDEFSALPVLADTGFHDTTYHKSTSEPEQESDDPEKEIIATLNEALDDLTKDYIVQVIFTIRIKILQLVYQRNLIFFFKVFLLLLILPLFDM